MAGFKFRHQHPVASYILDFCCHEALLAVELDGSQPIAPKDDEHNFWVFVDLGDINTYPRYWIVS
ncbi:MAG: endonuclease domain-containing protein [Cyanobacteriota bacterium]